MARVYMNVSGAKYEFDRSILKGKEYDTLSKLCEDAKTSPIEIVVDRPVDCFAAILSYYQTDELHMPHSVCPKAFKKELAYWGVSPTILEPCCLYRYYTFFDDLDTRERFRAETFHATNADSEIIPMRTDNKITRLRRRVWKIIEFKERTLQAKVYLAVVFFMVLLCIITLALSTVKSLKRKVKNCEMLEYLEYSGYEYFETVVELLGSPDCSGDIFHDGDEIEDYLIEYNDTYGNLATIQLPEVTVRMFLFDVLEYFAAAFFTVDLLLRLLTCPSLLKFFKSILNIFDIFAVFAFYLQVIIVHGLLKEHKYQISWVNAIGYVQIFRVMRLFRIVKNVRASRVLSFSLRSNAKDMILLALFTLICVSFFGSLIFFIENGKAIQSIPEAWYWTMITLTTVGYGDVTPKTAGGRFVAAILSICGVLLLSITLPMFVNNFLSLYQYSCMDETLEDHKKKQKALAKTFTVALAMTHKNKNETNTDMTELEDIDYKPVVTNQVLSHNGKPLETIS